MHRFAMHVYYEDTDFSGVVYHANYLRYFERAREHALGQQELVRMWREDRIGFVVYKATLHFKEGAVFGDALTIESSANMASPYRIVFSQRCVRQLDGRLLVDGEVEMVCVDGNRRPVVIPQTTMLQSVLAAPGG